MPDLSLQQLAQLAGALQDRSERERLELARLLHDELGGLLTAAKMDISWLQGRLAAVDDADVGQKLAQLESGLAAAMQIKRSVVETLRPALLEHFGLPTTLQALFEDGCRRAGLTLTAAISDRLPDLPATLAIALFRVGESSLENILRHAQAHNVSLTLQPEAAQILLAIGDDGIGMNPDDPRFDGANGISGMRHWITRLGGSFELQSAPGRGCLITVRVP